MKVKANKPLLDEMLERKLSKIEGTAMLLAFCGLFVAIVVQLVLGMGLRAVAGESAVLLIISVYSTVFGLKNGIWSRSAAPTLKNDIVASIIAAVLMGVVFLIRVMIVDVVPENTGLVAALSILAVGVGCFILLEIMRWQYRHKRQKLDGDE